MTKTIEIIVSSKGETRLETRGFSGAECRDASRLMEAALGITRREQLTAEFHTTQAVSQQSQQRN